MGEVGLADIQRAAADLADVARVTPSLPAPWLEQAGGRSPVHVKCENLQRSGSFKVRGAYIRLLHLSAPERRRGVVAASAGNHAQGVALAATDLGVDATVFMPRSAALPKVEATRRYGATVLLEGETVQDALVAADAHARDTGATLIHPFDHPDVVVGQGTVGLEIVEQVPDLATLVVPTGGGGLLAGAGLAVRALRPQTRIVAAQARGAASWGPSRAAGHPVPLRGTPQTMADGIAVSAPGEVPWNIVHDQLDQVVEVSEADLARGLLLTLEQAKLLVEPAGVAGVAAVLAHPEEFPPPVVVILSGGNVDPVVLNRVIHHGLSVAGRFVSITVRITDTPGALARLLTDLARHEVNVLDVNHFRSDPRLEVGEVEVTLLLETRGPDHRGRVLGHLDAAGYELISAS